MFGRLRRSRPAARLPSGGRVYAIGDIHGEASLLLRLLATIEGDSAGRGEADVVIVLLGDVVDRGPRAADIVGLLSRIDSSRFVMLKGNHEQLLVDACRGNVAALDLWLRVGGRATLASFGIDQASVDAWSDAELIAAAASSIGEPLLDWLDTRPTSWTCGDYFFAHAGIRPGVALADQEDRDLLWIRKRFLASKADHGKVVVHGHSVERDEPTLGRNRIGIDTGAHEYGRLTALGLEDDRQWLLHAQNDTVAARGREPPADEALHDLHHRIRRLLGR